GSTPTSVTDLGTHVPRGRDCLASSLDGFDSHRLHSMIGPMVQGEDASLACWQSGFNSRWVHCGREPDTGCRAGLESCAPEEGMRVRLPCLPLTHIPVVKRTSCLASNETFRVRLLVGVLKHSPVVQRPGQPLDVGKIGGSTPPGTTDIRKGNPTGD